MAHDKIYYWYSTIAAPAATHAAAPAPALATPAAAGRCRCRPPADSSSLCGESYTLLSFLHSVHLPSIILPSFLLPRFLAVCLSTDRCLLNQLAPPPPPPYAHPIFFRTIELERPTQVNNQFQKLDSKNRLRATLLRRRTLIRSRIIYTSDPMGVSDIPTYTDELCKIAPQPSCPLYPAPTSTTTPYPGPPRPRPGPASPSTRGQPPTGP